MSTLTVTYGRILPVWDGGPVQMCEVSSTVYATGPSPNDIAARLEDVRDGRTAEQIRRQEWNVQPDYIDPVLNTALLSALKEYPAQWENV